MTNDTIQAAADALWDAARTGKPIPPLSAQTSALDAESAYAIQQRVTERRLARGGRIVGLKIGLTARAVQRQLGVDQPDYGMLFADMSCPDGDEIAWKGLIQPKVEAEVALVMGADLPESGIVVSELMRAVDFALPAIEIVDSRIADWKITFVDTVADNASSALFVLGLTPMSLRGLDLRLAGMVMERRGEQISLGAGAACLGHPLNAAVWLANRMADLGRGLRAGDVVLTGALGPMTPVGPGDVVEARIQGLGSVRAVFGKEARP